MSHSSTSSSDDRTWSGEPIGGLFRTAMLALLVVVVAEVGARLWLGDDDDWKFWRIPVGERIDLLEARPRAPDVLFVGDSTAATNLVPEAFMNNSPYTAFNLGTRGNLVGSFEPTMIDHVLPGLHNQPRAFLVSFSGASFTYSPFFADVVDQVNSSLYARSARGELIWGDWFALARIRHLIRGRMPHQIVAPGLDASHGWRSWEQTNGNKRPNAKTKVPRAPWSRNKPRPKAKRGLNPEHLSVVERLGAMAGDRPVVVVIPPIGRDAPAGLVDGLTERAPDNVHVWDYSRGDFARGDGAHLRAKSARAFTRVLAERFTREGLLDP